MSTKEEKELSEKQKRFVEEYCIDQNATQAAIRAGYSPVNATRVGPRLVGKSWIMAAIRAKQAVIAEKNDIKLEELVSFHRNIMAGNMLDYSDWTPESVKVKPSERLTREQGARIKSISETVNQAGFRSVKIELHDPIRSAEAQAKLAGLNVERREHSGVGGKAIEHKHSNDIVLDWDKLETDEVKQLRELMAKATPTPKEEIKQ